MEMKKIALVIFVSTTLVAAPIASAHEHEYREYHGYENHYHHTHDSFGGFIGPALIGGVIGYEIGRPKPQVIYQQPQVVYTQPQQIYVYPPNVPVPPGMYCELRSYNYYSGGVVTNNYCHY